MRDSKPTRSKSPTINSSLAGGLASTNAKRPSLRQFPAKSPHIGFNIRRRLLERYKDAILIKRRNPVSKKLRGENRLAASGRAAHHGGSSTGQATHDQLIEGLDAGLYSIQHSSDVDILCGHALFPSDSIPRKSRILSTSLRSPIIRRGRTGCSKASVGVAMMAACSASSGFLRTSIISTWIPLFAFATSCRRSKFCSARREVADGPAMYSRSKGLVTSV